MTTDDPRESQQRRDAKPPASPSRNWPPGTPLAHRVGESPRLPLLWLVKRKVASFAYLAAEDGEILATAGRSLRDPARLGVTASVILRGAGHLLSTPVEGDRSADVVRVGRERSTHFVLAVGAHHALGALVRRHVEAEPHLREAASHIKRALELAKG